MAGACIYVRVSGEGQIERNAANLPTQEKKCRDHCKRNGLPLLKVFVEPGESARTADRPQLHAMLEYCRDHKGKVSHVIVADLSRLARNVGDQNLITSRLNNLGILLQSVDEPNAGDGTATGALTGNMLGALNQYYSDVLSERVRYRMREAVKSGRFVWKAPTGYLNSEKDGSKNIVPDPERAPLVKTAFEMMANGNFTAEQVRKRVIALGLRTHSGRPLSKQGFAQMLDNWVYCGYIKTTSKQEGELKVKGNFDAIISEEMFLTVQDVIHGAKVPVPHKSVNEDFPLRGFIRCYKCNRPLTAGWAKGRDKSYARYWCFTRDCKGVGISREGLESHFVQVLAMLQPTAELLAKLPDIAESNWEQRKERIAAERKQLTTRLNDETILNRKAIAAKLRGELLEEDFQAVKAHLAETMAGINDQLKALDNERSTLEQLIVDAEHDIVNLANAWLKAGINERRELQNTLFPQGLRFSPDFLLFEPGNHTLMKAVSELVTELINDGRGERI
jgi:site-specific DNA recombinase